MTVSRQHSKHMSFGRKHQRRSRTEYSFYFALIFLAALPICILQWVYALVTTTDRLNIGPVRRAWSEAQSVTPRIFWAY
jgi:hypothetical protein